ncbi:WD40-repeat-containing domain protein [Dioszegia hungarica]|uniref:WD40-repeat-containing domain protein n=1 Tax=Dioszegia hungarica TaxID=4972 RepID=A0AA38LSE6_9TREE|nr:WD40-repeat-containing domain protein [Dioszegia hungarica]KAI9633253.1 WD40-repeat-containing domain protein [Dioszegia hungarica]
MGDDDDEGDEEDDDEDGDGGAGSPQYTLQVDPNDPESGAAFLEIAALLNGQEASPAAQSSLLQRLLAGGFIRTSQRNAPPVLTPEERAEREAERRRREQWWTPQTKPHPRGKELLCGGEFGRVGQWKADKRDGRGEVRRPRLRETARFGAATLPNTNGTVVAVYPSVPYVGQYAKQDYSIFFTATQNFTLHLYNLASARPTPKRPRDMYAGPQWRGMRGMGGVGEDTSLKKIKAVRGEEGSWTITDSDSTRDGERMIYSSITPYVHMLHTGEHEADHTCLDFSGSAGSRGGGMWGGGGFGIWSIRFSADGKEVVAGGGEGRIMVYDIEAERRSLSIVGHADDVNAVCFADESSTNILVSGSDDGYVKIWDRRSLSGGTPSGVLVGATEGITYTSPKGDGRYIVVNSKDQAARLYDLRKMKSWSEFEGEMDAVGKWGQPRFDYRNARYPPPQRLAHPKDCSVMTYRGHAVLRTLIRCHFSPRESTGQGYIYSGSADGLIHIWSLDGQVVQVLDRSRSVPLRDANNNFTDPSAPEPTRNATESQFRNSTRQASGHCTRDVSWHGYEPSLMSTSWTVSGGYRQGGSIAKHEWKGLGKGGLRRLEDWVEREAGQYEAGQSGVQI